MPKACLDVAVWHGLTDDGLGENRLRICRDHRLRMSIYLARTVDLIRLFGPQGVLRALLGRLPALPAQAKHATFAGRVAPEPKETC
jgi:hypothetical protein